MTRLLVRLFLALFVLVLLFLALRQDLSSLALHYGSARLRSGDVVGAQTAFRRAVELGRDAAPLSYNLGVTLYHKGEFALARRHFDAAIASAGPSLLPAALYNRGNSLYRQAGKLADRDRRAAIALLQQALADYRRILSLVPEATDAQYNMNLVEMRLKVLMAGLAKADRPADTENGRPRNAATQNDQNAASQAGTQAVASRKPSASQSTSQADPSDTPGAGERSRRNLTHAETARLLSEARGRERPLGLPHAERESGPVAGPENDW